MTDKSELRRMVRERLRAMKPEACAEQSRLACGRFVLSEIFLRAQSLLLYMPLEGELDVRSILEAARGGGKELALPRFMPETGHYGAFFIGDKPLVRGPFGVFEPAGDRPAPLNRLDLIVVPGLGFDLRGRRLGRGKGFYDRLLSEAAGVKCGICFEEQLLPEIPVEPHDVGVDFLATPSRWQDCRGSTPEMQ